MQLQCLIESKSFIKGYCEAIVVQSAKLFKLTKKTYPMHYRDFLQ